MTRVLCLTSWFPPHHFGGYELSCQDVMERLTERGHHVEVLTSDHRHDGVADPDTPPVAAVHRTLRLYFEDGELWSPSPLGRLRVERHNQQALHDALESCRPDVVAVWHVGAMSLGLVTTVIRRGLPVVYAVSDDWPAYVRTLDPWTRAMQRLGRIPGLRRAVEAVTRLPATVPDLDSSGAFCFISEVTRARCRRSSPWEFPTSTVIYSGFDGRLFPVAEDDDLIVPRPVGDDPVRLLYVGRVDPRKGIRTLVRALARLPEATLVVDGRATEAERRVLEGWAEEEDVSDRVRVQCSDRADLPAVYRSADVCVFPSEWEEPFGLVPLEAMACDTPVVASGVGGSGEFLFDGGNCLLFEPGDPDSLAGAVRRMVDDADLRRRIVANGRISARHFDARHLADAFEAWHDAAAHRFEGPLPPDRRPPAPAMGTPPGIRAVSGEQHRHDEERR